MSEQSQDLVTKIDVRPELDGLQAFNKEIDRAIRKVEQLDKNIRRANELRPRSPYAPVNSNPGASAAAAGLAGGLGANLVNRTPIAAQVKKAAEDAARAQASGRLQLPPPNQPQLSGPHIPRLNSPDNAVSRIGGGPRNIDLSQLNWNETDLPQDRAARRRKKRDDKKGSGDKSGGFDGSSMLAGAATAYGLATALNAVARSMDSIQQQQSQLERLPQTVNGAKQSFIELNKAASDVRTDADSFISTYSNMATSTEKLKLSQAELIKSTQGLVGALQLGGGSDQSVSNALYQMGQAFSSDRFGGDEFRSFMEAIGTQAPEVAKAFGTDVKGLRKMSEQGKLTAEVMVKAFQKMADNNISMLNKQGWTWGQVTTVMSNDWTAFLATATSGDEWKKLTGWMANNVIPAFRSAEKAVSDFWQSITDESKRNMLLGILATIGAGFVALAIPVLAATWPFLAIGAAVWLALEVFQDFKDWMDGKGGNIFDSLFGSFDEFTKRYPNIVGALKEIGDLIDKVNSFSTWVNGKVKIDSNDISPEMKNQLQANKDAGNIGDALNSLFGMFGAGEKEGAASAAQSNLMSTKTPNQTNISNSGNTTIEVKSADEAAKVADSQRDRFLDNINRGQSNMAENYGAA